MQSNETPSFFIPSIDPVKQEELYADLAKWSNCVIPDPTKRIYSITFFHDSEEWTATVGKSLRGMRNYITRSRGKNIPHRKFLNDSAVVWAIFAGNPFRVVTDQGFTARSSIWANPFLVGNPNAIVYFPT
jgi:hypothetical protein